MPKIVIFIFAGIILLAGGGITLMQQLEIGPFASEEANASADAGKREKPKEPVVLRTITMDPLFIPIIQGNKVKLNLQLELQIKTPEKWEAKLQQKLPILKDAFIRDLFSFIPRHLRKSKELDEDTLKRRLKIVGQRAIGNKAIHSIVIKNYSEAKEGSKEEVEEKPEGPAEPAKK